METPIETIPIYLCGMCEKPYPADEMNSGFCYGCAIQIYDPDKEADGLNYQDKGDELLGPNGEWMGYVPDAEDDENWFEDDSWEALELEMQNHPERFWEDPKTGKIERFFP